MRTERFARFAAPTLVAALFVLFVASAASAEAPAPGAAEVSWPLNVEQVTPTPEIPLETAPPVPTPIAHPGDANSTGCVDCHAQVDKRQEAIAEDWRASVHAKEGVGCADCHGGDPTSDEITVGMAERNGYLGVPGRDETVALCGGCHANAERMRPYQIATDQYSKYFSSVHGQRLLVAKDTRVAICIDCHGSHAIKPASDPTADVYPLNVPKLCASCHADPDTMQPYGIPTDQFDIYKESVHGKQLLDEQDLRAPTCASCHGSHAAKPPRSTEVVDVCGKCHTATQALYEESAHSRVPAVGPKCWTCHGTHDVSQPDEGLFLHEGGVPDYLCATCHSPVDQSLRLDIDQFDDPADRRCDTCHHGRSQIFAQVEAIAGAIGGARDGYETALSRIEEAAALGMIVADAEVAAAEAKTGLIRARAAVHTTKLKTISELTDETLEKSRAAEEIANAKLSESDFRRQAMIVVIALIIVNVLVLMAVRRRLHANS
ncbi:MAG TPA: cytochrome c3 family protein [Candidatus Sulfomarinibacteraceae bacterium]|nr:cytochrome c3 family protein [Candidatus Sulfomarinibacteraceae bacterium]